MLQIWSIYSYRGVSVFTDALLVVIMHLSMLSPRGGTLGICGAFDFSEEFLVKIPTVGPQNWVKSDQISPPFPSIYIENE